MKHIILPFLFYVIGALFMTWLIGRWEMGARPVTNDNAMTRKAMLHGVGIVVLAWVWLLGLVWLGGIVIEIAVKLIKT